MKRSPWTAMAVTCAVAATPAGAAGWPKARTVVASRHFGAPQRPTAQVRAALPAFDRTGPDGLIVHTALPSNQVIPPGPDRHWWRGNAWAVTIPGLPLVHQGSRVHPERVMTWFLDRWDAAWQQRILDEHGRRGYTHFALSWPDSRDGNGQSIAQFVATARKVKAAGFFVEVFLGSKDYDPHNRDAAVWAPRIDPVMDALIAAHAVDGFVVAWEADLWNVAGDPFQSIVDHVAAKAVPAGVDVWLHFSSERMSLQKDGTTTVDYWKLQAGKVTGLLYQARTEWGAGMLQARMNDVEVRLALAGEFRLVAWELYAALQFSHDHPDENEGDLKGWEALCTPGPIPVSGFGNGARRPDGSPI
jgi:hypothetical protein